MDENFLNDIKIHGESNVWSIVLRSKELMLGLNETMDQLANSVH